ncbi:MAG: hypothetical protein OEO79_05290 [Gemmatimonadota bacterium]|nr:hypothetical protein [Gemmatimonadota bacterium]
MSDEKRYGDEEVKEIFDLASRPGQVGRSEPVDGSGLTLAELQDVGREVGLEPARIAEAAAALERRPAVLPQKRLLGQPISVGRVVELPRAPTDHEWDLLVAELRATFGAKGKVTSSGGLREWSNSNLHAYIEPTETGYRLRLGTTKGTAIALRNAGTMGILFAVALTIVLALDGRMDELAGPLFLALAGGAALVSNLLTLPPWVRERERQMDYVAGRATALLAGEPR